MRKYEFTERGKIFIALLLVLLLLVLPSAILAFRVMAREPSPPPNGQSPGAIAETPSVAGPQTTEDTDDPPPENGGSFNQSSPPQSSDGTPGESQSPDASDNGPGGQSGSGSDDDQPSANAGDAQDGTNGGDHSDPGSSESSPGDQSDSSGSGAEGQEGQEESQAGVTEPEDGNGTEPPASPEPKEPVLAAGVLTFTFSPGTQTALDSRTLSLVSEFLRSSKNTRNSTIVIETPKLAEKDAESLMKVMTSAFSARGVSSQRLEHVSRSSETAGGQVEVTVYYIENNAK